MNFENSTLALVDFNISHLPAHIQYSTEFEGGLQP
jgi:hypothetical protein